MEPQFLVSSHIASPAISALPLVSYNSSLLQRPKPCYSALSLSYSSEKLQRTPFLGQSLGLAEKIKSSSHGRPRYPVITAGGAVKRRKELPFDNVIQRDKKLKLVLKIRKILMSQPDRAMALRDLGRFRRALGLEKRRRFIALLRKFPGVFEIVEEGAYLLKFKLTSEAERLYLEEMKIRNEMEELLVVKLRKLLMMSIDKRILLEKIAHLRTDLGLPAEFRDTICHRYPQYFKVVATGRGPALELSHWDPELAVSAAELAEEENREREMEERNLIIDRAPRFNRVKLPKGLSLSKGEMRRICRFRDMPYISPYSEFSELRSGSAEKEKHACGVVHEILSLTLEKRTLVDHLTHFREEFRFSQQLRGMLIRHPDMFYVSQKGDRDSVFLREAYRDSQLIEKDKMLLIKERLRALVNVPKFGRRNALRNNSDEANGTGQADESGEDEDDDDEWSDINNLESDGGDDKDENSDDEWNSDDFDDDGEYDLPPDFNDENYDSLLSFQVSKPTEQANGSTKGDEVLEPVFPDGRPRERW
ncbi:protein WHAT'S THIS FACTOR 1 homolog, chloroplastic [Andrographis paniculata]|uniref:protein WHAT'S THIS FACTOR 1 homolog, chloroplastic n=1 Tax=Andrographis paniculata TaxID=175694 RepID=UPI0021E749A1|nr:protein WHAT'S THIS FACTOR 1 homolog, chloroplastic [Andrographis paniculata]XP_051145867.1 protein WHAT'S THIS FACTOR 1 homolog, chloroplastic [Andrographis paniculata]XP_051145872.1 protein WHAT'S THIS FACTOR 1 homolog, chloroplastic [Andrographis paniculata]XP_051145879.1 protein WHAT'S THIS FACTOR 1 homolog, chloroplastic [Andrographis paniculata]XP_051145887.1 protein WHAT'S THIS FACTOR 1 homolog, chloroplastic [Andrographis paniculata]XP_051145894.1 protein WHAT'S THIS FACTOR 1 homolo